MLKMECVCNFLNLTNGAQEGIEDSLLEMDASYAHTRRQMTAGREK
jgi:hypothetical protein